MIYLLIYLTSFVKFLCEIKRKRPEIVCPKRFVNFSNLLFQSA